MRYVPPPRENRVFQPLALTVGARLSPPRRGIAIFVSGSGHLHMELDRGRHFCLGDALPNDSRTSNRRRRRRP